MRPVRRMDVIYPSLNSGFRSILRFTDRPSRGLLPTPTPGVTVDCSCDPCTPAPQRRSFAMPTTELNGIKVFYESFGTGGTPVLLIAGLGGVGRSWGEQTAR